jgi:hypothetical protein
MKQKTPKRGTVYITIRPSRSVGGQSQTISAYRKTIAEAMADIKKGIGKRALRR